MPDTLGISRKSLPNKLYRGRGCEACGNTGYSGRIGIFEIFVMNDDIRATLSGQHTERELIIKAREGGMRMLVEDGFDKVKQGLTTLDELLRIVGPVGMNTGMCRSCGQVIDTDYKFCPHCGTSFRLQRRRCHTNLSEEWKNCPHCGEPPG